MNDDDNKNNSEDEEIKFDSTALKQKLGTIGIGLGMIICVGIVYSVICKISPGYAGVIYNMNGGVEDSVLSQGYHIVAPWKKVIEYPVSTETVYYTKSSDGKSHSDSSINVNTKDGKQVNVSVTYSFHMDVEKLPAIFTKFRGRSTNTLKRAM